MVTITNGNRTMTVSKGAFKSLFEPNGWCEKGKSGDSSVENFFNGSLVSDEEKTPENSILPSEEGEEDEEVEDEYEEDDEIETPISEMTTRELRAFAKEHGIDISEAQNKKELKKIVEAYMENN